MDNFVLSFLIPSSLSFSTNLEGKNGKLYPLFFFLSLFIPTKQWKIMDPFGKRFIISLFKCYKNTGGWKSVVVFKTVV